METLMKPALEDFQQRALEFPVNEYLRTNPFKPKSVFRERTIPPLDNPKLMPRPDSRFVVVVGDDPEVRSLAGVALDFHYLEEKESCHRLTGRTCLLLKRLHWFDSIFSVSMTL